MLKATIHTAINNIYLISENEKLNEKIIKIIKKTDPKNMAGFINIIESI